MTFPVRIMGTCYVPISKTAKYVETNKAIIEERYGIIEYLSRINSVLSRNVEAFELQIYRCTSRKVLVVFHRYCFVDNISQ